MQTTLLLPERPRAEKMPPPFLEKQAVLRMLLLKILAGWHCLFEKDFEMLRVRSEWGGAFPILLEMILT